MSILSVDMRSDILSSLTGSCAKKYQASSILMDNLIFLYIFEIDEQGKAERL